MGESEKKVEERKEKLKIWLKNPYHLAIILILAFAFIIRLYYFFITQNQALWWDEASYGTIAKSLINPQLGLSPVLEREFIIRPIFLPFLWFLLLSLNFPEYLVKFFLIIIPSLLTVFLSYLIAKEMFTKRIALISCFIFSVLWIHLFYSVRLLTDVPFLFFNLASLYFFVKSYKSDFKPKTLFLSIFFLSLSVLMRYPSALLGFIYLLFIVIFRGSLFKRYKFWFAGILGLFPLALFFIYNQLKLGFFFPALKDVAATKLDTGFAYYVFSFVPHYLKTAFFVLFIIGMLACLLELFLGYNIIRKSEKLKSYSLIVLVLLITFVFFIFIIKAAEDRYLFLCIISFVILAAVGLDALFAFVSKYSKAVAVILLIAILAWGAYQQITFGDSMIKSKKDSFLQMKEAFLWVKDNVQQNENLIVGNYAELYSLYYAERNPATIPENETSFEDQINTLKPAFLLVHAFNPQPQYIYSYPQQHQESFKIEKAFYFDINNPAVIIYKIQ